MADAEHVPWYDQEYKNNVLLDLNRERFEADSFCDATLQVGLKSFQVHKCIVGKVSPFFRKLFKVKMMETYSSFANMKGLTSEIMEIILSFIYTGTLKINDENVFDLLAASEYLLIDQLKSYCHVYLLANVDIETCIKYHSVAKAKKWILLERKAENIINQNCKKLIKQEEFTAMEKEDAILLFSALNQNASAFVVKDVYDVVMTWVRHDVELRKQFLPELLKLVKFRHLPEMFLKKLENEDLFKDLVHVTDMLDDELQWKRLCNEDMIVISGGTSSNNNNRCGTNTVESFSINGSKVQQVQMQPMMSQRYNHAMVNCEGTMYCFGSGYNGNHTQTEKYENHSWKSASSQSFASCAAVATNNEIFVIDASNKRVHLYAAKFNEWKKRSTIPAVLNASSCDICYMEGKVFVFGLTEFKNQEVKSPRKYVLADYDVTQDAWQINYSIKGVSDGSYILAV